MKHLFFAPFLIFNLMAHANAQFLGNQDGKMIENNMVQIGLLKSYALYLDRGLSIAHDGLDMAHSLKKGEFGLHGLFYASFSRVNPAVMKYPAVGQVISVYGKMARLHTTANIQINRTGMLSAKEKAQVKTMLTDLMEAAKKDMEGLGNLLTDGKYQLTDDERLKRIDDLLKLIVGKYYAFISLENQVNSITLGRKHQKVGIRKWKQLYDIP